MLIMTLYNHLRTWSVALPALCLAVASCSDDATPVVDPPTPPVTVTEPDTELDAPIYTLDFQDKTQTQAMVKTYNLGVGEPDQFSTSIGFKTDKPWILTLMDSYSSTNFWAGSTSGFTNPVSANSWLVTNAINIPNDQCVLTWKAESYSRTKLDGYSVYISTTGGNPRLDFSGLEPVFRTEAEPAGDTDAMDGEWNEHTVSLADYAGKTVYIAFVHDTKGGAVLGLDDISVVYRSSYALLDLNDPLTLQSEAHLSLRLEARDVPITSAKVHLRLAGTNEVYTQQFDALNLAAGQGADLQLSTPVALKQGNFTHYSVWAEVEGLESVGYTDSIAQTAFIPQSHAVLEEGTGTWCGWCTQGILAIEHLEALYPERFIPVAVHNDASKDPFVNADYDVALSFQVFPIGLVNRTTLCNPMRTVSDNNSVFDGAGTFQEAVEQALAQQPLLEVHNLEATYADDVINVRGNVRWAVPTNRACNVAYIITENKVTHARAVQENYLSQYDIANFGRFRKGGEMGKAKVVGMEFEHVARGIQPDFYGSDAALPARQEAGKDYPIDTEIVLSKLSINEPTNCYVTVIVTDKATAAIINAARVAVK